MFDTLNYSLLLDMFFFFLLAFVTLVTPSRSLLLTAPLSLPDLCVLEVLTSLLLHFCICTVSQNGLSNSHGFQFHLHIPGPDPSPSFRLLYPPTDLIIHLVIQ